MRFTNQVGAFELASMPGCPQVGIVKSVFILPESRGQGHGRTQHEWQLTELKRALYDYAMCTVRADNEPQIRILERNGWARLISFNNRATGHEVLIFGRQLNETNAPDASNPA